MMMMMTVMTMMMIMMVTVMVDDDDDDDEEENYENYIIELSIKYQIPLIATQEVFYLTKDMHEAHDALVCIGEKNFVDEPNRFKYSNQHFLKQNEDLIQPKDG